MASPSTIQRGTVDINTLAQQLDRTIDTMWMRRNKFVGALARFFDIVNISSGRDYTISDVGSEIDLPIEREDGTGIPYMTPPEGFKQTFNLATYKSGVRVTQGMLEAERFDKVVGATKGQLISGMQKDERLRADVLNSAFSGTAGADGVSLCNNSHPHEDKASGTWDNLGTGALSGPNLQALCLLLDKITNAKGEPCPTGAVSLLVAPEEWQKAKELTGADGKPEGMLNDPNVRIGDLEVVKSHLITSPYYFVFGNLPGYERGLMEVVLSEWALINNNPHDGTVKIDKQVRATKAFGITRSKNVAGSAGS